MQTYMCPAPVTHIDFIVKLYIDIRLICLFSINPLLPDELILCVLTKSIFKPEGKIQISGKSATGTVMKTSL